MFPISLTTNNLNLRHHSNVINSRNQLSRKKYYYDENLNPPCFRFTFNPEIFR